MKYNLETYKHTAVMDDGSAVMVFEKSSREGDRHFHEMASLNQPLTSDRDRVKPGEIKECKTGHVVSSGPRQAPGLMRRMLGHLPITKLPDWAYSSSTPNMSSTQEVKSIESLEMANKDLIAIIDAHNTAFKTHPFLKGTGGGAVGCPNDVIRRKVHDKLTSWYSSSTPRLSSDPINVSREGQEKYVILPNQPVTLYQYSDGSF